MKKSAHHALNMDADGNIWYCSTDFNWDSEDQLVDKLNCISPEGKELHSYSIKDILVNNGLEAVFYMPAIDMVDKTHLNDIQPVLKDGPYWKQGDLFVSLRNLNMVFLYRPSIDSILWHSFGPWINQHDVDILTDSTIAVFNNNRKRKVGEDPNASANKNEVSNVIVYNIHSGEWSNPVEAYTQNKRFYTGIEGSQEFLNDHQLIMEETIPGYYHFVDLKDPSKNEIFSFFSYEKDTLVPRLNWFRIQ